MSLKIVLDYSNAKTRSLREETQKMFKTGTLFVSVALVQHSSTICLFW